MGGLCLVLLGSSVFIGCLRGLLVYGTDRCQLIDAHQAQVHHVANVEVVDPVVLLFEAQIVPHRYLELSNLLHCFYLLKVMKANIKLFPLRHEVVLAVAFIEVNISLFR